MPDHQPFLLFGVTPGSLAAEQVKLAGDLLQGGLDFLYLRVAGLDAAGWQQLLLQINPQFYPRLVLPLSAPAHGTKGAGVRHIREAERREGKIPGDLTGNRWSTSCHALDQVPALAKQFDFAFYSPVFPSISKPGYGPVQTLEEISGQLQLLRQGPLPRLIALGGISENNIGEVKAAGFHGAALLGALWQNPDPLKALAKIKRALAPSC